MDNNNNERNKILKKNMAIIIICNNLNICVITSGKWKIGAVFITVIWVKVSFWRWFSTICLVILSTKMNGFWFMINHGKIDPCLNFHTRSGKKYIFYFEMERKEIWKKRARDSFFFIQMPITENVHVMLKSEWDVQWLMQGLIWDIR